MTHFLKNFLILFCFSLPLYAAPSDDLIQLLNNIHTMQATFNQTVLDTKGKILNRATGKMSLQRPGQFRWDVMQPNRQLIVTNGQKIWIYDVDLEQVTVRYLGHEAGEAPALLLSNSNSTLANDFQIRVANDAYVLTPKDKSSMFETITLRFANQTIHEMQLADHLGHVTHIQFNQVVMNRNLSASLFNFKAPAHVDVIDETHR